jgi:hypothetical protein
MKLRKLADAVAKGLEDLAENLADVGGRLAALGTHRAANRGRCDLTCLLENGPVLLACHPNLHGSRSTSVVNSQAT